METIRSLHLQKNLGQVLESADDSPLVLVNRGVPRSVIMSASEFRRLKNAAGEPIPPQARERRPEVITGRPYDPLGYDTSDFNAYALKVADDALSGRNREAVDHEVEAVERRLGLR